MSNTTGAKLRVCKRNKELFKGFPYFVAVDIPKKASAWYLRADGTVDPDCCDDADKQGPNSGWFANMDEVDNAIARYEEKNGVKS